MIPEGECGYIRQSTSTYVITNICHFQHSKNLPKLTRKSQHFYICSYRSWLRLWEINITSLSRFQFAKFDCGCTQYSREHDVRHVFVVSKSLICSEKLDLTEEEERNLNFCLG